MKTHKVSSIGPRALTLSILVLFAGLGILGGSRITSAASDQTYNNVQIFVSPQNSTLDTFSVSAYNSTGGLVASSQSSYPAFSFELPSGEFLFTVTASSIPDIPHLNRLLRRRERLPVEQQYCPRSTIIRKSTAMFSQT